MQRFFFLFVFMLVFSSCKQEVDYENQEPLYQTGDRFNWAETGYNDQGWRKEKGETGDQIFWLRSKVSILDTATRPLGIEIYAFGAYDVYWDGLLIGHNGQFAIQGKAEIPGSATANFQLPPVASGKGVHLLALRATQAYSAAQRGVDVKIGYYADLLRMPLIMVSFMHLMAGAFLIASIYYFFLYLNSRRKEYAVLVFAVVCLLFFALLITEYVKFYIFMPYTRFYTRLEIIGWLTFSIAMLVPFYFTIQFNFKWKGALLGLLFSILIAIYLINFRHYDLTAMLYSLVMWITSTLVVLYAIFQKEKGGVIVLSGLLVSLLINKFLVYDFGLFICFTVIVLCMLYLHTIRARVIEEEYQSSLLLSSRLKLELIKKNIQPHFLRNTLTSLIDWVEESPAEGVRFITALAAEFDIMNAIADESLIPVNQEIELCKSHVAVMQFRKEIAYRWTASGIDDKELVPPALIHTMLENGITHSIPPANGEIGFHLHFERGEGYKQYTFKTTAQNRVINATGRKGNGVNYIKARLNESYGDAWTFNSEAIPEGWLTTIKIYTQP